MMPTMIRWALAFVVVFLLLLAAHVVATAPPAPVP